MTHARPARAAPPWPDVRALQALREELHEALDYRNALATHGARHGNRRADISCLTAESTDRGIDFGPADVTVGAELGRGGYGAVLAAVARVPVAVKRLHALLVSPHNVAALTREGAISRSLCHPNVVRTLGTVIVPDRATPVQIVMELHPASLEDLLFCVSDTLTLRERLDICLGLARGVTYLHSRGVAHADLRPGNVLLNARLTPMVADLGLARRVDEMSDTAGAPVLGPYNAPERTRMDDGAAVRERVQTRPLAWDAFSLAVLVVEVLTGCRPAGDSLVHVAGLARLDVELASVLSDGMAGDPAARPAAAQFVAALGRCRSLVQYTSCPATRSMVIVARGPPRRVELVPV